MTQTHPDHATDPAHTAAHIEQKALRLSALLRDIDTHPLPLDSAVLHQLDATLSQLASRVSATHALLKEQQEALSST